MLRNSLLLCFPKLRLGPNITPLLCYLLIGAGHKCTVPLTQISYILQHCLLWEKLSLFLSYLDLSSCKMESGWTQIPPLTYVSRGMGIAQAFCMKILWPNSLFFLFLGPINSKFHFNLLLWCKNNIYLHGSFDWTCRPMKT